MVLQLSSVSRGSGVVAPQGGLGFSQFVLTSESWCQLTLVQLAIWKGTEQGNFAHGMWETPSLGRKG